MIDKIKLPMVHRQRLRACRTTNASGSALPSLYIKNITVFTTNQKSNLAVERHYHEFSMALQYFLRQ